MQDQKNNKVTQTLSISKDQKSEKLRIKLISVLLVKTRTKQANKGREIIVDNSIKKYFKEKGSFTSLRRSLENYDRLEDQ